MQWINYAVNKLFREEYIREFSKNTQKSNLKIYKIFVWKPKIDGLHQVFLIDDHIRQDAEKKMDRLKAERNLQFELDNFDIGLSTPEQVVVLNDKVVLATEKGVATQYIEQASELRDKMAKAIQAKKILKMFNEYPAREIPDPIQWDPKTKKPIDPITGKPIDPLKLALQNQKKKKKKEPKFVIPEWANDVKSLDENLRDQNLQK